MNDMIHGNEQQCPLDIFPLQMYLKSMKVAEKDRVVYGMIEEEYQRCKEAFHALQAKIEQYPKGALNVRKKKYKGKDYSYHYLVSREEGKVVNRHVAKENIPRVREQIEERDKYKKELKAYAKRIAYLERLMKASRL
ncbi:MAG TPA: hypothetical protein PKH14_05720 [Syntrophorhabdus sp.]|nr:hypothetical protein [Syntrophorhabdus sp.]